MNLKEATKLRDRGFPMKKQRTAKAFSDTKELFPNLEELMEACEFNTDSLEKDFMRLWLRLNNKHGK